ncbi:hypothetical protein [Deinococcus roseus]|uniref:HEPN domain-containing protein n=1 Tax=Deinococcus roseus TaxID=392414 RepID=A0ABQ2D3M7_9DEIO|nr:hypothetical protein [Deinococcus roseus]GGJ41586.1 hypothetical protein GCM10008938_29520 [Deinococcus roseus]
MAQFEKTQALLQAALQLLKGPVSAQAHNQVVHHLHDAYDLIRPDTRQDQNGQPFEPLKPKLLNFSYYQRHATEVRGHTQEALDELEFMLEEGVSTAWVNSIADSLREAYDKL